MQIHPANITIMNNKNLFFLLIVALWLLNGTHIYAQAVRIDGLLYTLAKAYRTAGRIVPKS